MSTNNLYKEGLQYDDLTPEQKKLFLEKIWNGVGSREFFINPHDLIFGNASIYHDFFYWRGGSDKFRIWADKDFLTRSLYVARQQKWYLKHIYILIAYVYYFFLSILGKYAWEYYDEPAKTWTEFLYRYNVYHAKKGMAKKICTRIKR